MIITPELVDVVIKKGVTNADGVLGFLKKKSNLFVKHIDDAVDIGVTDTNTLVKMSDNVDEAIANGRKFTEPELPTGGKPKGNYETPDPNDPAPITRQNEAADLLADKGYDVEMLPETSGGNGYGVNASSNPDYLINGEVFDCYSPQGANVRNIWSAVKKKTEEQARRVIINLDDCTESMDDLANQFLDWSIDTLDELLITKNGKISRLIIN